MLTKEYLKLAERGLTLNGYRGQLYACGKTNEDYDAKNREYLRALASAPTTLDPESGDTPEIKAAKDQAAEILEMAIHGDRKALRTLNAIRIEQVNNFVVAESKFMGHFEVVTLADNEQPYVQNETLNEIRVGYLSQDGRPRQIKIERPTEEYSIPLRTISTERVWYKINDIYKGHGIAELARKTFDLARDMRIQLDREVYGLLNATVANGGAYGPFSLTGSKVSRLYVPHSVINTSHFPTTNDIIVKRRRASEIGQVEWLDDTNTQVATEAEAAYNGFFGTSVLMDIVDYANRVGDNFGGGPLVPTGEVIVPAIDIRDILFGLGNVGVNLTEGEMQKQIQERGFTNFSLYGVNWKLIPDTTIPSGRAYPKFNKSPGRIFIKPSQDKEFVDTDLEKDLEHRWQKKVIGPHIISQQRVNTARFTYKDVF